LRGRLAHRLDQWELANFKPEYQFLVRKQSARVIR
jgi:hypothetical protein